MPLLLLTRRPSGDEGGNVKTRRFEGGKGGRQTRWFAGGKGGVKTCSPGNGMGCL